MKQSNLTIIPSQLEYKSAPSVDQKISISLFNNSKLNIDFDRSRTVNLAQIYDDERQSSTIFRPTFQVSYIYDNAYLGVTNYVPFRNNLYYYLPEVSVLNGSWTGNPQFYEFDFFRPDVKDNHFTYEGKSAYTYNWQYYITYPFNNNYNKVLNCTINNASFNWVASNGIPFKVSKIVSDGNQLISFECVAPHGLQVAESVELSFSYQNNRVFEVYSLGNDLFDSGTYIFNVFDIGYTGNTFYNGRTGTFKRVIFPDAINETKSKYYVRQNKVLNNLEDIIITKTGFQRNAFSDQTQLTLSSITPNKVTRISKKNSSNAYTITCKRDLDLSILLDNQKRPLTEIYLSIINKGYSGYFNKPFGNNVGLKQGWFFNITQANNPWWDDNNISSNSNITVSAYTLTDTSGNTKTFYYNQNLKIGDVIDGDFCEWNEYEQVERVISPYYHKIKFNQDNFQTTPTPTTNADGYYYEVHNPMTIRVFSNAIETGSVSNVDQVPSYSFFSDVNQEFRWRDIYLYGFIDEFGRGVDYPYLNNSHYPYGDVIFRLFPEGLSTNDFVTGINIATQPLIDGCE